jgi:hypothetical protein
MPNLVGIGLSQVPTNSMLGGLAYQDPENASIKDLDLKNLSQINSEIFDTANDVFVYDTRKDSDGGAWRKRTQHTSWYNETLGTEYRGTRREFPAVAVIVSDASSDKVTIYDGDDPDLPMWMVFSAGNPRGIIGWATSNITRIKLAAMNGIMVAGTNDSGTIFKFVEDFVEIMYSSSNYQITSGRTIADRNNAAAYDSVSGTAYRVFVIGWYVINDVSMTVLPNAPIDDRTGLPVPTIAIAHARGISIIMDDGNVITSTSNSSYPIYEISIFPSGELYHRQGSGSNEGVCFNYPYTRIKNINLGTYANSSTFWYGTDDVGNNSSYLGFNTVAPNAIVAPDYKSLNIGDNRGLTFVDVNKESLNHGMSAFTASNYSTGWMHGDVKGAFLSDTDTTDAIEYVQNGYFNNDVSSWTIGTTGTTATLNANRLLLTAPSSGASWGYVYQGVTTVIGKTYKVSLKYDRGTVDGRINVRNDSTNTVAGALFYADLGTSNDGKTYYNTFTATATTTYILLYAKSTSGGTSAYDEVSVTLEHDRSVNRKGLQVYGTVPKQVVATGAELVAYSNFSASNHLRQPPNSDMNIGTGDAYMMIWFKTTNASGTMMMISYEGGAIGTNDYGKPFNIRYENGSVRGWASHNGFSTWDDVNHGVSTADGQWHCAAWVKRGQVFELYIDGEFIGSDTGSVGSNALSDANSELVIGARKRGKAPGDSEEPWNNGSLALARIGKSAPSAEQVKKIYEDEKVLFQENAKATLYGSSDAVTALGYDKDTELLHVGTSAGRSDFQGLRRINNTTTAVTTAISASDELIAEQ